ncbi:MAG: adenylate/guanylate cyclase domain-containing protein [Verrucomicrobiae bacterium]|nr:adenylate/guanylate cyclase domain-containing protein [Verrucomicrobiae bacterium]
MSATEPSDSTAEEEKIDDPADLITASLIGGRQTAADFMNAVRLFVTSGFALVYLYGYFGLRDPGFVETAPHLLIYWGLALLLWVFGKRSKVILGTSRFAVPLIDIPVVTLIQMTNIAGNDSPDASAVYTLALFVFLTAMSSFSLRARHLIPTTVVGMAALVMVYRAAQLSTVSLITGPLLLLMTALMMSWLPRRQNALIREAAIRESRRNRLARYFSPGVAELIEDRDDPGEGESCEISVLFCDIRGFTSLSENLDASEVVQLLNDFHGHMVDEIFRFGGTLDKYLGDGLLAWFNAPVPQTDHALRAVRCALAMVERLEVLNAERETDGKPPLKIGIGLHAGAAVVGNIGAAHRREFTAIGDTVNVASRLQTLTKEHHCDILLSEAVVQRMREAEPDLPGLTLSPVGSAEVRGRKEPVTLFVPQTAGKA